VFIASAIAIILTPKSTAAPQSLKTTAARSKARG
jgi:hypothetical protein